MTMKEQTFDQSLSDVLAQANPLPVEQVPLTKALGRVLAQDALATVDEPPAPKSRMDGFALRATDTTQATQNHPLRFSFQEVVGAGHLALDSVGEGRAIRLMTGAWLPEQADAVVKQEDTIPDGPHGFQLTHPLKPGENVISAGGIRQTGERMVEGGAPISPQAWGMLASLGQATIQVHRQPRVALLALGDELVEPGIPLKPGQLHVSNIFTLEGKVRAYGGTVHRLGIALDDPEAIQDMLKPLVLDAGEKLEEQNSMGCDLMITLGGSHGGDFDFAARVVEGLGAEVFFRRTRFNMGASTLFAKLGRTLFFGLPGTPMPSWASFELLVRPALWRLAGRRETSRPLVEAELGTSVVTRTGFKNFIPAWLTFSPEGRPRVEPLRDRKKDSLPPALLANALILVPDGVSALEAGERVQVAWIGNSDEGVVPP